MNVTRNSGKSGLWPKLPRREQPASQAEATPVRNSAPADSVSFRHASLQLADVQNAGTAPRLIRPAGAGKIVRDSADLKELIQNSLQHAVGRPVNLGKHEEKLAAYVAEGLKREGYPSFEDIKGKV